MPLTTYTAGQVLTAASLNANFSFAASNVQIVSNITGAVATGTTQIPLDDTIPQNTEGDQYLSLAITPTSATNMLVIQVVTNLAVSTGAYISAALFQDSTANALGAVSQYITGNTETGQLIINYKMAAGTTSATTFKVRCGLDRAGTTTFNGFAGNRKFGGVYSSSIIISEYPQ